MLSVLSVSGKKLWSCIPDIVHTYRVTFRVSFAVVGWCVVYDLWVTKRRPTSERHERCSPAHNTLALLRKLGLETVTHVVVEVGLDATTVLRDIKSKQTLTLAPYGPGDHAAEQAAGRESTSLWHNGISVPSAQLSREQRRAIRTLRFPRTALCLLSLLGDKTLKWGDANSIMKDNNKADIDCRSHRCIVLCETCSYMINGWMSLSPSAALN